VNAKALFVQSQPLYRLNVLRNTQRKPTQEEIRGMAGRRESALQEYPKKDNQVHDRKESKQTASWENIAFLLR